MITAAKCVISRQADLMLNGLPSSFTSFTGAPSSSLSCRALEKRRHHELANKADDQDDEMAASGIRAGQGCAAPHLRFPCCGSSGRSLVAAAVAGSATSLFFAIVLSAGLVIVAIRALFPAGRLFPIAFASLIAVYAAIFSLFVEEIFRGIDAGFLVVGFCLPIFFFVAGCWLRRA
jgi:hypothetical protein